MAGYRLQSTSNIWHGLKYIIGRLESINIVYMKRIYLQFILCKLYFTLYNIIYSCVLISECNNHRAIDSKDAKKKKMYSLMHL